MSLLRLLLVVSVLMFAYAGMLVVTKVEHAWIVPAALFFLMFARRARHALDAYGTARWISGSELAFQGMFDEGNGPTIGLAGNPVSRLDGVKSLFDRRLSANRAVRRFLKSIQRRQKSELVWLNRAINTAVFAPVGSGKGVSIVIPHLLTSRDPTIVIDPKGELYRATAKARAKFGHRIVRIDPFGVISSGGDTFNVLADIDPESDTAPDECRAIANAIVVRTGKEDEAFWSDSAEAEIALAIGFVVCFADAEEKNLQTVRKFLSDAAMRLKMIEVCRTSDKWHGLLARWAGQSASLQDKTLHSVIAHVHTHMRFLDTPAVMRNTTSSSFQPKGLFGRMTIYLCLPPEHLRAQAGLMRLWIGSLLRACVKNGAQERKLVRFILDEAAALGRLDVLADAIDQYRGYGVRLMFVYQSLGQLSKCWPDGADQALLSNVTQIFFGVNDQKTAEYLSARLGEWTQVIRSSNYSRGGSTSRSTSENGSGSSSHGTSWNEGDTFTQAARKLLQPSELTQLDPRIAITLAPSMPPIWTWLIRYYEGIPQTQMSLYRVVVDTTCFFLLALMVAVIATAAFNPQLLRSVDVQDFRTSPEPALDAGAFDARWHP